MAITNKMVLPFTVKNNVEISGGYATQLHSDFFPETLIADYHLENLYFDETIPHFAPLQSPFTNRWVGGLPYRHIDFNTGSDSSENRPEGYHIRLDPVKITLYSHAYRNSPPAYWTRDGRSKRPVNISNIPYNGRTFGNYRENYEFLQTSGRRISNNLIVDGFTATGVLTTQFVNGITYSVPKTIEEDFSSFTTGQEVDNDNFESSAQSFVKTGTLSPYIGKNFLVLRDTSGVRYLKFKQQFTGEVSLQYKVLVNRTLAGNIYDAGGLYLEYPDPNDILYLQYSLDNVNWTTLTTVLVGGITTGGVQENSITFTANPPTSSPYYLRWTQTYSGGTPGFDHYAITDIVASYTGYDNSYTLPELNKENGSRSVIVERFNAPGSKEESSRGALDREGEEMSANIALPWRNYKIRQPFYSQLSQSFDKINGEVSGTIHGVHRNNITFANGRIERDNWYVSRNIPRSDLQYYWITASSITTPLELGGFQSFRKPDGTYYYNRAEAYTDIVFTTGSLVTSGSDDKYEIDNLFIRSLSKDTKNLDLGTNTFSMAGTVSASFAEITNTNYYLNTWNSLRIGETPVARSLKKNNYLSLQKRQEVSNNQLPLKRSGLVEKYKEPVVTFKYKPLYHEVTNNGEILRIKHEYQNSLSSFANKELIDRLNFGEEYPRFYNYLLSEYTTGDSIYESHRYSEIVWPREENTGLSGTRKREKYYLDKPGFNRDGYDIQLGTQRAFWRDNQINRQRSALSSGGYYSSFDYLSTEEIGSNFLYADNRIEIDLKNYLVTSSFSQSNSLDKGLFNSFAFLEKSSSLSTLAEASSSISYATNRGIHEQETSIYNQYKVLNAEKASGEANELFYSFYERFRTDSDTNWQSIGSLYQNTTYKSLLLSDTLEEETPTEDQELRINPKIRYTAFVGGVELNTSSYIQNVENYSNDYTYVKNSINDEGFSFQDEVSDFLIKDNYLYIVGSFDQFGNKENAGGICRINMDTKEVETLTPQGHLLGTPPNIAKIISKDSFIYVFGLFSSINNQYIRRCAKYNLEDGTWSKLGSEPQFNSSFTDAVLSGSDIYLAGNFTLPYSYMVKYNIDSDSFINISGSLNGQVNKLLLSGSDLYAGGYFTTAGGTTIDNGIAKYDTLSNATNAWTDLYSTSSVLNNGTRDMALDGNNLYAIGAFNAGTNGTTVRVYDTTTTSGHGWSYLQIPTTVHDTQKIEIANKNMFIASMYWDGSAQTYTPYLIKYEIDNAAWTIYDDKFATKPISSVPFPIVRAMVENNGILYIGGNGIYFDVPTGAKSVSSWDIRNEIFSSVTLDQYYYKQFPLDYTSQVFSEEDFAFSTLDRGLIRTTEQDSGKKPFFDSYNDYIEDIRGKTKDYSVIPEFTISQDMPFYDSFAYNFRYLNSAYLTLDGISQWYRSAWNAVGVYRDEFMSGYVESDFLKKKDEIEQENKDISKIDSISVKLKGIKKLLPYNGFYPQDRTLQLTNLYKDYVGKQLRGGTFSIKYKTDQYSSTANKNNTYNISNENNSLMVMDNIDVEFYKDRYYLVGSSTSTPNNTVYDLLISGSDLYAFGEFTQIGNAVIKYIAKYDLINKVWRKVGNLSDGGQYTRSSKVPFSIDGKIYFYHSPGTVDYYICTIENNQIVETNYRVSVPRVAKTSGSVAYIGATTGDWFSGSTTVVSNQSLVRFDPANISTPYSSLYGGSPDDDYNYPFDSVSALEITGSSMYAGGKFNTIGGSGTYKHIAVYDTTTTSGNGWTDLYGGGVDHSSPNPIDGTIQVNALALYGSDLYVGGYFNSAGGVSVTNIAKYDTTATSGNGWSAIPGYSVQQTVTSLHISGSDLYIGTSYNLFKYDLNTNTVTGIFTGEGAPEIETVTSYEDKIIFGGSFQDLYSGDQNVNRDKHEIDNIGIYDTVSEEIKWDQMSGYWKTTDNTYTTFQNVTENTPFFGSAGKDNRLISASNGLNYFTIKQKYDGGNEGYLLHSFSEDGETWTKVGKLQVKGTSDYITGSFLEDNGSFGWNLNVYHDNNTTTEKIFLSFNSYSKRIGSQIKGELYLVTGSLIGGVWEWSQKISLYTGSDPNPIYGTPVPTNVFGGTFLSCSSGYQIAFSDTFESSLSLNKGEIYVITSSNGEIWSDPVAVASGSAQESYIGFNGIQLVDFNNKSYIFATEPGNNANSGLLFVISSSESNDWGTSDNYREKIPLYEGLYGEKTPTTDRISRNISTFVTENNILYYCFANPIDDVTGKSQLFLGKTLNGVDWKKYNRDYSDGLLINNIGKGGFGSVASTYYYTEDGEKVPVFITDRQYENNSEDYYELYALTNNQYLQYYIDVDNSKKMYEHAALEPLMAPGILYNTIKSGIAVDWPCVTGSEVSLQPYGTNTYVNAYYPKSIRMASYQGENIYESSYGLLRSKVDYRAPFESILFPEMAFAAEKEELTNIKETTLLTSLPENSRIRKALENTYIYGGYETYLSPLDFYDINNIGPKKFNVPFVYRKEGSDKNGLYTLAMSNFLAETVRFFLKGEEMVSFVSKEDDQWGVFESGKTYYMDVILEKSKDLIMMEAWHSNKHPTGSNGEKMNGRYFGYPVNKTDKDIWGSEDFTLEEGKLIHNDPAYAPYTPPYYEGKAIARISFTPPDGSRTYNFDEVVAASNIENIFNGVSLGASTDSDAYLNAMPVGSSVNLFGSKRGTILDSTGLETQNLNVKQWVISPKMETPVLDFSSSQELVPYQNNYSKTSGFGRGMWSGYGQIPGNGKEVNLKIDFPFPAADRNTTGSLVEKVFQVRRPSEKVKSIGRIADQKVISEAVVVIPYLETKTNDIPTTTIKQGQAEDYNFIRINDSVFSEAKNQVDNNTIEEETSITKMISSMKKYVIPPNMNFLQYDDIEPFVVYVFEVEHILDQQDLVDIWQGLMPKISYTAEEIFDKDGNEGITIEHQMGEKEFFHGQSIPEDIKWMVFKVKRKAETDYAKVTEDSSDDKKFSKRIFLGRQEGEYSYNWPYDYFSLVEFGKIELDLNYKKKEE